MKNKILIGIAIIGFIIIIIFTKPDILPNVGKEKFNDLELIESMPSNENNKINVYKDRLVIWNGDSLEIIENKDEEEKIYDLNLNIENPIIRPGKDYIYVANQDTGLIYFIDEKAEMIERVELAREIFNIDVKGKHILYHAKGEDDETIGIINNKGQNVMKYDFKDKRILSYDLNDSLKKCLVAILEIEEDSIGSRLYIYNDLKEKEEIFFEEEVLIDVKLMQFDNIMILTDKKIYYISGTEIVWEKEIELLKDYEIIGNDVYLMSGNKLDIINTKGDIKKTINFDGSYNKFLKIDNSFLKERYIFYNDSGMSIYEDDEILKSEMKIEDIYVIGDYIFINDEEKLSKYQVIERISSTEEGE